MIAPEELEDAMQAELNGNFGAWPVLVAQHSQVAAPSVIIRHAGAMIEQVRHGESPDRTVAGPAFADHELIVRLISPLSPQRDCFAGMFDKVAQACRRLTKARREFWRMVSVEAVDEDGAAEKPIRVVDITVKAEELSDG